MKDIFSTDEEECNFFPNAVITDQGGDELLAIKVAFPGVPIFYCAWNVLRVWERQVNSNLKGLKGYPVEEREEIKKQVCEKVKNVRNLCGSSMEGYSFMDNVYFFYHLL